MTVKSKGGKSASDATEAFQGAVNKGQETIEAIFKGYDEAAEFGRDAFEAIVASTSATNKGVEAIQAEVLAYSKTALEESLAATKAALTAKSVQELVELQSDYAKSALDAFLQQATRVGELTTKVSQEAFGPINARVQAAVERLVKPVAAY